MEEFFSFLRPRTPEPSFDDLFRAFSEKQSGQGVVTRRQAQLAQSSDVKGVTSEEVTTYLPEVEARTASPKPSTSQIENEGPELSLSRSPSPEATDLDVPYLKETLIASNSDVEAYCIKTHFRRMKNFA